MPRTELTTLIEAIADCRSIECVWALYVEKMREYGFDRMIFAGSNFLERDQLGDISDAVILTNHEEAYLEPFFKERMFEHAPMLLWCLRNEGVCSWQWAANRYANGEMSERELHVHEFNLKNEVIAGYTHAFEAVGRRGRSGFGLCARRGITQDQLDRIWAQAGTEISLINKITNLKLFSLPLRRWGKDLTDRQHEVLHWTADGKTIADIATILNLTVPTVEKHLRLARQVLNVETTAQAVLKLAMQNQIFVIDAKSGQLVA